MKPGISVIAHNIRSTHNVGSIFRTCDGLGVEMLHLTGYTPYPKAPNDTRLPHISEKLNSQIHKTALGAETTLSWLYTADPQDIIKQFKSNDTKIIALEQHDRSTPLPDFRHEGDIALLLGEEVAGVDSKMLDLCDAAVEIPMFGRKESYNVSIAAAIALYHFRFYA